MTLLEKIEAQSLPEPNSGCLLWMGGVDPNGYGRIRAFGENRLVHRVYYTLVKGPIPEGKILRHKCDVPSCISPDHLLPGTQADNVADMLARGRENRDPRPYHLGERNPNNKIAESTALAILLSPLNQRDAAKQYGVAPSWVQRIRKREVWPHIQVPANQIPPRKFFLKMKTRQRLAALSALGGAK